MKSPRCHSFLLFLLAALVRMPVSSASPAHDERVPVILITDLYHPFQDPGDNLDALTPFGLPDIDLRAVILDATQPYLRRRGEPVAPDDSPTALPREPGFIAVLQLNWLFDRFVPVAAGPFTPMRSVQDQALDVPHFQQAGVDLLLRTLRESPRPVEIVSTGSARVLAIAFNRDPVTMRKKVARIHLALGSSDPKFLEWNVHLDPKAVVALLRTPLPIAIYPCATAQGPFDPGPHNTYWSLPDLLWIKDLPADIRAYVAFALTGANRVDFLAALEEVPGEAELDRLLRRPLNVWETALWMQVTHRSLVRHAAGDFEIVPTSRITSTDEVLHEALHPVEVAVADDGTFRLDPAPAHGRAHVLEYERTGPEEQQAALRQAYPRWLRSFLSPERRARGAH